MNSMVFRFQTHRRWIKDQVAGFHEIAALVSPRSKPKPKLNLMAGQPSTGWQVPVDLDFGHLRPGAILEMETETGTGELKTSR